MPKIHIDLEITFETTALLVDEEGYLDFEKGRKLFKSIDPEELEFEIISTNEDAECALLFSHKNGKKGSVFEVNHKENNPGLFVSISGSFSLLLRRGADTDLKKLGSELDLRLRAVTWKGGAYMGFAAIIEGGDYEQSTGGWRETFPKIANFSIK